MREENEIVFLKIANIKYYQSAAYFLEELLKDFDFNYFQSKEIYHSLDGLSGKIFHSATHTLLKDREDLILTKKSEVENEIYTIESVQNELNFSFEGKSLQFSLINIADFKANFAKKQYNALCRL